MMMMMMTIIIIIIIIIYFKVPRFEFALQTKVCVFTKIIAIRSFGHGLYTYCSA